MDIKQSGEPVGEVVELGLLKKQLRIADDNDDGTDDFDTILSQHLAAAVEWVQDVCGTVLLETPFTATGTDFCLSFEGYPNANISAVTYVDELGAPGTITAYEIKDGRLVIDGAPRVKSAKVEFKAGLGAGNVPEKLKVAVLQLAEVFYDKSGDGPPASVRAMVAHHRGFAF